MRYEKKQNFEDVKNLENSKVYAFSCAILNGGEKLAG